MVTSAPRSNNVRAQGGGGPPAQRRGTLPGGAADPADPAHGRFPSPTTPARRPPQSLPASRAGHSGGTGTFHLAVRPVLESRTAPPWAVATRGMLGSPGGRAQASPRSHARPGLTNGPVSRTARGVHTTRAHSHLQPMSADIVRQRLGGVPVDPVHGPVAAAGRRPARGVGPASMWHPGRGVGGTAGKTARPAACSAGLVGRRCVGGNAGPTFSASAAGRTRRRRGRPGPRSSARPWWLDWPVQRIV
jgi:hypothetical protein